MHENKYVKYWFDNGILHTELKVQTAIDMTIAKEIVTSRLEFCKHENYPVLMDYDKFKYADKEVRVYMNTEGLKGIKAGAFLTSSLTVKTFFNFYLSVSKPPVPAKVFNEKAKALQWLAQFAEKKTAKKNMPKV